MRIATEVNKYLDQSAPWFAIKTDKNAAAKSVYTALRAIDSLKILFAPFLPFTSEKLHSFFNNEDRLFGEQFTDNVKDDLGEHEVLRYRKPAIGARWEPSQLRPGTPLQKPGPLFKKLDEGLAETELEKLGN